MNKYYQKAFPFSILFSLSWVAIIYVFFSIGHGLEFNMVEWPDDPETKGTPQGFFSLIAFIVFAILIVPGIWLFEEISKPDKE